jgi:hypothetical protein
MIQWRVFLPSTAKDSVNNDNGSHINDKGLFQKQAAKMEGT